MRSLLIVIYIFVQLSFEAKTQNLDAVKCDSLYMEDDKFKFPKARKPIRILLDSIRYFHLSDTSNIDDMPRLELCISIYNLISWHLALMTILLFITFIQSNV
jgi:hypothetical protein